MDKKTKIIIGMGVIVLLCLSYIGIGIFAQSQDNLRVEGANNAVAQIFNEAIQCKSIPLSYGNVSINLVAYECFQQELQGGK